MKWFQHHSDTYSNIKMQEILECFGLSGYGLFWLCCELVAQQGKNYQIDNDKNWKKAITRLSGLTPEKLESILFAFSNLKLIDQESLEKNILFIPKMSDYSDDYTNKLRRKSEQTPDNNCTKSEKVVLDKIRIDKNRIDKKRIDKNRETSKEVGTAVAVPSKEFPNNVMFVFEIFKKHFGTYPKPIKGKKGNYDLNAAAATRLVKIHTRPRLKKMIEYVLAYQNTDKFCRISTSPLDFEKNYNWYKTYFERKKIDVQKKKSLKAY